MVVVVFASESDPVLDLDPEVPAPLEDLPLAPSIPAATGVPVRVPWQLSSGGAASTLKHVGEENGLSRSAPAPKTPAERPRVAWKPVHQVLVYSGSAPRNPDKRSRSEGKFVVFPRRAKQLIVSWEM